MFLVLVFALLSVVCGVLLVSAAGLSPLAAVLLSVLAFFLMQAVYALFFWAVACTVPKDRPLEKQNAICRFGAGTIVKVINFYAGVHPVITGIEKIPTDHNFLYVSNHRSMFDPLVVMGILSAYNIAFISKPANMNIPFGGRIAYAVGYLAIDRENDRNAMKTILTAADYLKRGICNIGVYPEGTRIRTDDPAEGLAEDVEVGLLYVLADEIGRHFYGKFRPLEADRTDLGKPGRELPRIDNVSYDAETVIPYVDMPFFFCHLWMSNPKWVVQRWRKKKR